MKKPGLVLTLLFTGAIFALPAFAQTGAAVVVCFSPPIPGGCDPQATILRELAGARNEILVQAYVLTARPVVDALIRAHARGVVVRIILDRKQLRHDRNDAYAASRLVTAGIPVAVDDGVRGIAHNKVIVIDGRTVITGSYNFTWSAEHRNAENMVVINDPVVAAEYLQNWRTRESASAPLQVR
jgi:phosphatidylserine/phosphatidylglycerophosphate/cardiolipin synthase-like enzyme